MTTTVPPQLADLSTVLTEVGRLVGAIEPQRWSDPTPCTEWDLRHVVGHLIAGNQRFAAILNTEAPPNGAPPRSPMVEIDDDAKSAYDAAAEALLTAFALPGKLEATLPSPFGPVPGNVLVRLRIAETLVHGWDIAQASGQRSRFPDAVVEQALRFSQQNRGNVQPGRAPFAPPVSVDADADPLEQLVALLGRDPGWAAVS